MAFRREPPPGDEQPTEVTPPTEATRRMPAAEEYGYVEEPPLVEQEVVEGRRRPPTLWPYLLALLVLVAAIVAAVWYFTRDEGPSTQTVASVVRLPEGDAVQRLRDDGFRVAILRRPSDQAEQGIVFAQRPGAGEELEEGSTVTILVSSGAATAEVPEVTGLPADRAEELLKDAGFTVRRVEVFSDEDPGTVVAQDPAAGERAPRDASVRINVSKGSANVQVPDVVGRTAAEAGSILRRAGLATPRVVSVPSDRPENEVVAQNPPAGAELRRGGTVRINVSNGEAGGTTTAPAGLEIPDVVGQAEDDAVQAVEDAGATARVTREDVTDPAEDGVVLRQDPPAGPADEGTVVELVVGRLTG
jgi:eukaryotic-like serine/threonine-protein kinase